RTLTAACRHRRDEIVVASLKNPTLVRLVRWTTFGAQRDARAVRLRRALEDLGAIFVKFWQLLSTRRDLLPTNSCRGRPPKAAGPRPAVPIACGAARDRAWPRAPDRRGVLLVRRRAGGVSLDRAGALCDAAQRSSCGTRSGRQGAAAEHACRNRQRPFTARHGRSASRAAVARRQAA